MSTSIPQIIPEKIIIRSIKVLGGNIEADEKLDISLLKDASYDIRYEVLSDLLLEEKLCRFIITINIQPVDLSQNRLPIKGSYKIEFIFYIDNLPDFIESIEEEIKKILFHPVLLNTLASIVYSTARGIILTRTQGTSLDGVILPVIDPRLLVEKFNEHELI
jgi:hypothetical protein